MKIGIFGGSFDPIHLGHTRIINEAIISLQLDKMLIVPTKHNPWKEDSVANNQQRIEMIQIALKDNSKCEVCTLEIDRQDNEKNYTIDTIKELKDIFVGCIVMKNDSAYIQGIPDLLILYNDKWAALEVKKSGAASHRPNQEYYVDKMDDMSFARFIYPQNKEEVLNELQQSFGS